MAKPTVGHPARAKTVGGEERGLPLAVTPLPDRRKVNGVWEDRERLLLPGYVIAVTDDLPALATCLRSIMDFTRVLSMGQTCVPLREDEYAWIESWTRKGDRTIPISIAHKVGDRIVVTEGPLKGREGVVKRINRRKCLAVIELHVDAMRITTQVGLAIYPEGEGPDVGD